MNEKKVDLEDVGSFELVAELERRGEMPEDGSISDYSSMELSDELESRGDYHQEIDAQRLYEWLRDQINIPTDIRDMVQNATGRVLP